MLPAESLQRYMKSFNKLIIAWLHGSSFTDKQCQPAAVKATLPAGRATITRPGGRTSMTNVFSAIAVVSVLVTVML